MTKKEIIDLINAKIAGQGSAVDVGGALPAILKGLADLAGSGGGGGGGSLEFAEVTATPEAYVSFEVFVEWGFTEDVYSKLCSGEYAGFVTENGGRYLIVATYPENVDRETPAGFAYCDNNGRIINVEADYTNETVKIDELDGVSVVEIDSLPHAGIYSAQQMAEYGITLSLAELINNGHVVGLVSRENLGAFYGVDCAYGSIDPESGDNYIVIVLRSRDKRYTITFGDNGLAVVVVKTLASADDIPGVVTLWDLPNSSMTTQDDLDGCGLTTHAIQSLASGNAVALVTGDPWRMCILGAEWLDSTNYKIAFQSLTTKYVIENSDGTITVTETTLS